MSEWRVAQIRDWISGDVADTAVETPVDTGEIPDSMRVLIGARSEFWQRLLRELLETRGGDVTTTQNGVEATDRAVEDSYDVILLDRDLPIKDGFEAAADIREETDRTGIVLLVSDDAEETIEKARSSGVDEILVRPFQLGGLRSACRAATN